MTCWEGVFKRALSREDESRIDREVEELRRALYLDTSMNPLALARLIMTEVHGTQVETRVAADGHDLEFRDDRGLWLPVDVEVVKSQLHMAVKQPLALPVSSQQQEYSIFDVIEKQTAQQIAM